MLSLVMITTMANHEVTGLLIDDGSACNLMYLEVFRKLDLWKPDLNPCEDRNLLAFNNSTAHPC